MSASLENTTILKKPIIISTAMTISPLIVYMGLGSPKVKRKGETIVNKTRLENILECFPLVYWHLFPWYCFYIFNGLDGYICERLA